MTKLKTIDIATLLYNEYKPINEKVNHIDCGGCGVFAEHLYKVLTKLGIECKLVVITGNVPSMNRRIKGLPRKRNCGYGYIEHIMVEVDKMFIDHDGIAKRGLRDTLYSGIYKTTRILTIDVLEKWNADPNIWNDMFNREHISTIEEKLKECYEKVQKHLVVS